MSEIIDEYRLNLLTLLMNDDCVVATETQYYDPNATDRETENLRERVQTVNENFYFREFFDGDNSPEINVTRSVIKQLINKNTLGFVDNIAFDNSGIKFLSDPNSKYLDRLISEVLHVELCYISTVSFLKYVMKNNLDNKFTPVDLTDKNLGKKTFLKEFKNYIKIVPTTLNHRDFLKLLLTIQDILLEENVLKNMSHWDLYAFSKYYLSFDIDENLDCPYIKVYTRDEAEAAHLSLSLMNKDFVDLID
jgi:hypothetical protein